MLLNIKKIKNGDFYEPFEIYRCNRCGCETNESFPHFIDRNEDYHLCWDCGFIEGRTDEEEYIRFTGIALTNMRAEVINGKIVMWRGKKHPKDRTNDDERRSYRYKKWRKAVFERDEYRCQDCGQRGGELNAHHLKSFAKYKELRYEITNGLTLCLECHRNRHRKKPVATNNGHREKHI